MTSRALASLTIAGVLAVACSDGMGGMGGDGGDGGALGGSARTETLAEVTLDDLPNGPLAWTGYEVTDVEHQHAGSFVHAREDTTLTIDGEEHELAAGEARWLAPHVPHRHGRGTAWDVLLVAPGAGGPPGSGPQVLASGELEDVPEPPVRLVSILVELPPGASTSVHTHPGPEFIRVTEGTFTYENGEIGAVETSEGDGHAIGRGVPVQKRNPEDAEDTVAFLSWFIVDPDEPFASGASFE